MGKKAYIYETRCQTADLPATPVGNITHPSFPDGAGNILNNNPVTQTDCDNTVGWGSTPAQDSGSWRSTPITTNRYLHFTRCQTTLASVGNITHLNGSDNTLNNVDETQAECNLTVGWSSIPALNSGYWRSVDMLGNRYVYFTRCQTVSPSKGNIMHVTGAGNTLNTNNVTQADCDSTVGWSSVPAMNSGIYRSLDLLDNTRGYGYLEYQMTAGAGLANGSTYGTNATFASNQTTTDSTSTTSNLTISNNSDTTTQACQSYNPATWEINGLNLNDAEIKTDQNFICNYQAKICVYVFIDNNSNNSIDTTDSLIAGINVKLSGNSDGTAVATIPTTATKDGSNNWIPICFTPLLAGKNYDVTLLSNPGGIASNNLGDGISQKAVAISFGVITKNLYFGFNPNSGSVSITADSSTTFGSVDVKNYSQNTCGTTSNIQVIDTRNTDPGWLVSAVVDDFVLPSGTNKKLFVGSNLTAQPQNLIIVQNLDNGSNRTLGNSHTVSSTTDPITVMQTTASNGQGTTKSQMQACLDVPSYSPMGTYTSIITFTVF
jgi:hypothetical protein